MSEKLVFEGIMPSSISERPSLESGIPFSIEDGGAALILDVGEGSEAESIEEVFVRLQSYDERVWKTDPEAHPFFRANLGKKVRITVEMID